MDRRFVFALILVLLLTLSCAAPEPEPEAEAEPAAEPAAAEPTAEEQIAEMEASCAAAQEAMQQRQTESPLFDRLGGREGIHAMVTEVSRLHLENEQIKHYFEGTDSAAVIEQATDFLSAGAGGDVEYQGRDIVALHEPMNLTAADFLAAGADFDAAMTAVGIGDNEKQEVVCAFVGLRDQVMATEGG